MLDRIYFILRHKTTGEIIKQQGRSGELLDRPSLYISEHRAKFARSSRQWDVDYPQDWEIVPVKIVEVKNSSS
jgi:hypothetical protein